MAVWIWIGVSVELGDGDGLDDREALCRAVFEILRRLLAVEPVKQLPGGVAEVEERLAIGADEVAAIVAELQRESSAEVWETAVPATIAAHSKTVIGAIGRWRSRSARRWSFMVARVEKVSEMAVRSNIRS